MALELTPAALRPAVIDYRIVPRADGGVSVEKAEPNGTWLAVAHFASREEAQKFIDTLGRPKDPPPDHS